MPPPKLANALMIAGLVILLAVGIATLVACGAEADDPPKSMPQIQAEICGKLYKSLQNGISATESEFLSDDAYQFSFYRENCGR